MTTMKRTLVAFAAGAVLASAGWWFSYRALDRRAEEYALDVYRSRNNLSHAERYHDDVCNERLAEAQTKAVSLGWSIGHNESHCAQTSQMFYDPDLDECVSSPPPARASTCVRMGRKYDRVSNECIPPVQ